MARRAVGTVLAGVLAAALLGGGGAAATAGADPIALTHAQDAVALLSDAQDPIGQGLDRLWSGADDDWWMSLGPQSDGVVDVELTAKRDGTSWDFEFAPPPGQRFVPGGIYTGIQRATSRTAGHAGIDISGDGRGCNDDSGEFEVRDVAYGADGNVTRLDVVFIARCDESQTGAMWGEVHVGEPDPGAPIIIPSIVRWPETNFGRPRTTVPVTFIAGNGDNIGKVSVGGGDAGDFTIGQDRCSGYQVSLHDLCQVAVGFRPPAAGTRTSTLSFATDQGTFTAPLQGWSYGGTTAVHLAGDAGDRVTRGNTYDYSPANADIVTSGTRHEVITQVEADNGDYWYVDMTTPDGTDFAPGQTYNNAQLGEEGDGDRSAPRLSFRIGAPMCDTLTGSFVVDDATRWFADGTMGAYAASFEQHCENAAPAARGTLQWRVGDTSAPAPWMAPDAVPGATPGGGGGGGASGGTASGAPAAPASGASAGRPVTAGGRTPPGAAPRLKYLGLVGKGKRTLRFTARLPRAGSLSLRVTVKLRGRNGKAQTVTLGDGRATVGRAGTKTINIGLRKKVLKALAHVRTAPLTARVTWRPKGARAITSQATGVLRLRR
jgi:hypothetical protein